VGNPAMAKSGGIFTIFYAWQSDTPQQHNRKFIEDALKETCERLNADDLVPYQIELTSDTKGAPGLCDIPAVILDKIAAADAVVLDLTFVAKTEVDLPKHCPNPNVLFELGYAFHAIGPERLICVMNEVHGPADKTLFDIHHRRHPVSYTSPAEGKTRKTAVSDLADKLVAALMPTVALGPRSGVIDASAAFNEESDAIEAHWASTFEAAPTYPLMLFSLRPARYVKRRFKNPDELEAALRKHQVVDLDRQHHYPPSQNGTDVMPWGYYNDTYGTPRWALTYSGQLWANVRLGAGYEYKTSQREMSLYPSERDVANPIAAGKWIDYPFARVDIANVFKFGASWATAFHPSENIAWSAHVINLRGVVAAASPTRFFMCCSRVCASPSAQAAGEVPAGEFEGRWQEYCVDILEELFGMFDFCGDRISRATLEKFLREKLAGRDV
jgi:hypothetical protein